LKGPVVKNPIVGTIYRPPNQNLLEFRASFQPLIERVTKDKRLCYIIQYIFAGNV